MKEGDTGFRTIGRQLAHELTDAEIDKVSGGMFSEQTLDAGSHGPDDHSPTGSPCSDCD